jgi:hypothetical protein
VKSLFQVPVVNMRAGLQRLSRSGISINDIHCSWIRDLGQKKASQFAPGVELDGVLKALLDYSVGCSYDGMEYRTVRQAKWMDFGPWGGTRSGRQSRTIR